MKKAVMYGAGNIGRGFVGLLFARSGYEVVFIDVNETVINRLNKDKSYPVKIISNDGEEIIEVKNVRGVNANDPNAVAKEIAECSLMATAVGVNVLPRIARTVAMGISLRHIEKKPPLNILLCENLLDCDKYFKVEIIKYIHNDALQYLDNSIGLIEASIGRMVPNLEGNINPLAISVEPYTTLQLNKDAVVGDFPNIADTVLYTPFNMCIERKLYIHNMCHAMTAYLGVCFGYKYISEAIEDPIIKLAVQRAGIESARAIALANNVALDGLLDFIEKLLYRFNNHALKDTVLRVGRDPLRKIKKNDRLVGAYLLAEKHGVPNGYIALGIASLLSFNDDTDIAAKEMQQIIKKDGISVALEKISGVELSTEQTDLIVTLYGFVLTKDIKSAINYIEKINAKMIRDF